MSSSDSFVRVVLKHAVVSKFFKDNKISGKDRFRVLKWLVLVGIKETTRAFNHKNGARLKTLTRARAQTESQITLPFIENVFHSEVRSTKPPVSGSSRAELTTELEEMKQSLQKVTATISELRCTQLHNTQTQRTSAPVQVTDASVVPQSYLTDKSSSTLLSSIGKHSAIGHPTMHSHSSSDSEKKQVDGDDWDSIYPKWWPAEDAPNSEYALRKAKKSQKAKATKERKSAIAPKSGSKSLAMAKVVSGTYVPIPPHLMAAKRAALQMPTAAATTGGGLTVSGVKTDTGAAVMGHSTERSELSKGLAFSIDMSDGHSMHTGSAVLRPIAHFPMPASSGRRVTKRPKRVQKKRRVDSISSGTVLATRVPRHIYAHEIEEFEKTKAPRRKRVESKIKEQIRRDRLRFKEAQKERAKELRNDKPLTRIDIVTDDSSAFVHSVKRHNENEDENVTAAERRHAESEGSLSPGMRSRLLAADSLFKDPLLRGSQQTTAGIDTVSQSQSTTMDLDLESTDAFAKIMSAEMTTTSGSGTQQNEASAKTHSSSESWSGGEEDEDYEALVGLVLGGVGIADALSLSAVGSKDTGTVEVEDDDAVDVFGAGVDADSDSVHVGGDLLLSYPQSASEDLTEMTDFFKGVLIDANSDSDNNESATDLYGIGIGVFDGTGDNAQLSESENSLDAFLTDLRKWVHETETSASNSVALQ